MTYMSSESFSNRLNLSQISPNEAAAFSPNFYKWMKKFGHFYRGGGVLQRAFKVMSGSRLSDSWGENTLLIGYITLEQGGRRDFIGANLMSTLCLGEKSTSACYLGAGNEIEEIPDFWKNYLSVGRCAIDPDHKEHFQSARFIVEGETRTCRWCGALYDVKGQAI